MESKSNEAPSDEWKAPPEMELPRAEVETPAAGATATVEEGATVVAVAAVAVAVVEVSKKSKKSVFPMAPSPLFASAAVLVLLPLMLPSGSCPVLWGAVKSSRMSDVAVVCA